MLLKSDKKSTHNSALKPAKIFQYAAGLKGRNLANEHCLAANEYAQAVRHHPSVVGVVLLGGAARGFTDKNSDIDIVVFVSKRGFRGIRVGEYILNSYHFDVTSIYYKYALDKEWTVAQRWGYFEAKILYDRYGKMRHLLRCKIIFPDQERKLIIVDRIIKLGWYGINYKKGLWRGYYFWKSPNFWLRRGDVVSAHHILTLAEDIFLDILFAYNKVFNPGEKWKFHMVYFLKWLPPGFKDCFKQSMLIQQMSDLEFKRRFIIFMAMFRATVRKIEKDGILPGNIYSYLLRRSNYYKETSI